MKDKNGDVYLPDIDTYLWLGFAKNYVKYGHSGDIYKDGVNYYSLRGGRFLLVEGLNPIAWSIAKLYQLMHFFNKDISLMYAAFILPIILMSLSVIPAYLIGKRIAGDVAGFFAGIIMASHGSILFRTMGGVPENDSFIALFGLISLWYALKAIDAQSIKQKMIWGLATGIVITLFNVFWSGFWYSFLFILLMIICYSIYLIVLEWRKTRKIGLKVIKQQSFILGIVYFGTAIINAIIYGWILGNGIKREFLFYYLNLP